MEIRRDSHQIESQQGSPTAFHRAIRKYGWKSFEWEVLKTCEDVEDLDPFERFFISRQKTKIPFGYNMTDGGEGGSTFHGRKHSDETRLKISHINQGRKKNKTWEQLYGVERANQIRAAVIKTMTGKKRGSCKSETKEKISQSLKGQVISQETRDKISLAGRRDSLNKKLNSEKVLEIRRLYFGEDVKTRILAEKYGVSASTIWEIVTRRTWKWLIFNLEKLQNGQQS